MCHAGTTNAALVSGRHYREIDVCRGLGIVLVVLGHALKQTGESNPWFEILLSVIYSFHMPLFFVLSGFVSVKILSFCKWSQRWDYMKGRAFRLLLPYFTIGLLYAPLKFILSKYALKPYDFSSMWRLLVGENPNTVLWFLYSLFFCALIGVLLLREKSLNFWLAVSFAVSVFACCMSWSARVPKYCFFYILGIYVRVHYDRLRQMLKGNVFLAALVIFSLANAALLKAAQGGSALNVLWEVTALTGCILSLYLALRISASGGKGDCLFALLGKYSMDIYILSEPIHTAVKLLVWNILHLNYLLCTVLCFILGLGLPIPVSKHIVRKVKWFRMAILGVRQA